MNDQNNLEQDKQSMEALVNQVASEKMSKVLPELTKELEEDLEGWLFHRGYLVKSVKVIFTIVPFQIDWEVIGTKNGEELKFVTVGFKNKTR